MRLGAYQTVPAFAYPGWRLTVPGGPAGGQYKGFTHTQGAGTDMPPQDQYEQDREDGMSSHDAVHATQRNPRGVYRSSGEVPPRPNASGRAHSYRSFQTERHAGTSVAPGSFPADFFETGEDDFLSLAENAGRGLGLLPRLSPIIYEGGGSVGPVYPRIPPITYVPPPNTVAAPAPPPPAAYSPVQSAPVQSPPPPPQTEPPVTTMPLVATAPAPPPPNTVASTPIGLRPRLILDGGGSVGPIYPSGGPYTLTLPPSTGATSVVNQPAPTPTPAPPSPSVPVAVAPPISPAPSPVVSTNQVVPLNDGSGNYLNLSTGLTVPPADVSQNPATGQLVQTSSGGDVMTWLEQPSSLFPSIPNWGLVAGAAVAAAMLMGGGSKRR